MRSSYQYALRCSREAVPAMMLLMGLAFPYLKLPPFYDGKVLYDCLKYAVHGPFDPSNFLCSGHPSFLFVGIFSIPEYFFPGSLVAMHLTMLLLGCLSLIAFSFVLVLLIPERRHVIHRCLGLLLYASQPVVVANAISFNLDLGVLFFGTIFLAFLIYERYLWASLAALMLVFSKEAGLLVYVSSLVLFVAVILPRSTEGVLATGRAFFRKRWAFLVPLILFALYCGWRFILQGKSPVHMENRMLVTWESFRRPFTFFFDILFFQFRWFQTALTAAGIFFFLRNARRQADRHGPFSLPFKWTVFLLLLFVLNVYLLTRALPFNNPRYLLFLFPLGILLFVILLPVIFPRGSIAVGCLGLMLAFNLSSLYRSDDPISLLYLGTFGFGNHRLFAMGSAAQDGDEPGRDQLVYNLEYVKLLELQEIIFRWMRPTNGTVIVAQEGAYGGFDGRSANGFPEGVDPVTFHFSDAAGSIRPAFVSVPELFQRRTLPESVYYMEFPNFKDNGDRERLRAAYRIVEERTFQLDGYGMHVLTERLLSTGG